MKVYEYEQISLQLPFPKNEKASKEEHLQRNDHYDAHHANDHDLDFASPSSLAHASAPP